MEDENMNSNFWSDRNVFITGTDGFVGHWITKFLLERNANVIALIKKRIKGSRFAELESKKLCIIEGDVLDFDLLKNMFYDHEIDTCFHLAAQAIVGSANQSPIPTFETNIRGSYFVLEAARLSNVKRIVVASSDKAYGDQENLPYTEESSLNALHPYDASKACTDILARVYFKTYNLPVVVTRCCNIYGEGDMNLSRIVPDAICSMIRDKNPIIRSDGTPIRQYIYVEDVTNAYLLLAEKLKQRDVVGQAFNFGSSNPISVLDLVEKIIKISGKTHLRPEIRGKSRPKGEIDEQYLSSEKAKRILGWQPRYSLDDGLKKTIEWYRREWQKTPDSVYFQQ